MSLSLEERAWAKVCKGADDECWPWTGPITRKGYGVFDQKVDGKRARWYAHRLIYTLVFGKIPKGLEVDHDCHNLDPDCRAKDQCQHRRCCNPKHLVLRTHRDNLLAGKGFGSENLKKTHCLRGHPLSGPNLYTPPDGSRCCRKCRRMTNANLRKTHKSHA